MSLQEKLLYTGKGSSVQGRAAHLPASLYVEHDRFADRPLGLFDGIADSHTSRQFRVDYLKSSGAIGFYHPDWVVVQKTAEGEVHWIIETKGRVWEGTEAKDAAIRDWCQRVTEQTGWRWEFARVNQATFQASNPKTLAEAVQPAGQRMTR